MIIWIGSYMNCGYEIKWSYEKKKENCPKHLYSDRRNLWAMATVGTKRQSYTRTEKLQITTIFRTTWKSSSPVRVWYCRKQHLSLAKSKQNLQQMPRCADRGRKAAWPRLEQDLMAWITKKRNDGLAILPNIVRLKALELSTFFLALKNGVCIIHR